MRAAAAGPIIRPMAEDPIAFARAEHRSSARTGIPGGYPNRPQVRFERGELNRILGVYGRMVAAGEWRDYAMDFLEDRAVFSIFRRTSEMPLYRIEKRPRLKTRQGQYSVVAAGGEILKRGHELGHVLRVLEKKLIKALAAE